MDEHLDVVAIAGDVRVQAFDRNFLLEALGTDRATEQDFRHATVADLVDDLVLFEVRLNSHPSPRTLWGIPDAGQRESGRIPRKEAWGQEKGVRRLCGEGLRRCIAGGDLCYNDAPPHAWKQKRLDEKVVGICGADRVARRRTERGEMVENYGRVYRPALDIPIGWALAIGYLLFLLGTTQMGYARDEGYYFVAGHRYISWVKELVGEVRHRKELRSLQRQRIEHYWRYNNEHPPLAKLLMGASWWLFADTLKWMSNATAYRFPGMCWAALMILLVYLWGTEVWNRRVGLFAAFSLMLLPRFFFHAHLAAFDVPVSALWLLVCYAFWKSLRQSGWGFWCGVFAGLALATKHNAWILPAPLGLYWLAQHWNQFRLKILPGGSYQVRFQPLPSAVTWTLVLSPILLVGLWPLLWPDNPLSIASWKNVTFFWLREYVVFHLAHVHYDAYYFGILHMEPPFPWHFPFVMTLVTFPAATMVLMLGGVWISLRQQRMGTHLLWWVVVFLRLLFASFRPLLLFVLMIASLVPFVLGGIAFVLLWLVGSVGSVFFGQRGERVHQGTMLLQRGLADIWLDIQRWFVEQREERVHEYQPRPVGPADKTGFFWLLNALIPIAVIALPSTPIFGGTKHWMPAWPFLALMGGVAFERLLSSWGAMWSIQSVRVYQASAIALACLFLSPALIGLWRSHPHGLAYYNTFVGGPRGSANWKLQRAFWATTMRDALPWMNRSLRSSPNAPAQDRAPVWVHFHDTNYDSYRMYLQDGLMDGRIRATWSAYPPTRYIAFIHQKWLRNQHYHALSVLGARTPVYGIYLDDVPLLTFWEQEDHPPNVWW